MKSTKIAIDSHCIGWRMRAAMSGLRLLTRMPSASGRTSMKKTVVITVMKSISMACRISRVGG